MEPQDFSRKLGDVHDIMTFYDWQGFAGRECYNVMDVPYIHYLPYDCTTRLFVSLAG